jgi:2-polyprenyl-3-methyl-5-hydroxy-6-metoxy-1,4-benzoquinol methylase
MDKKLIELVNSKIWPEAVSPMNLCNINSEEDKEMRAKSILDILLPTSLDSKKFLDFGCGEGHVSKIASKTAKLSIGYDINCKETELTTNDLEKIKKLAPFEMIFLYDVLDHVENPIKTLKLIMSISDENTQIITRCHPWVSRHGGHLYRELNKAFAHIILNEEELSELKIKSDTNNAKVVFPIKTYKNWFEEAGLKIESNNICREEPEKFFKNEPTVLERLKKVLNVEEKKVLNVEEFPLFQMGQSFHDYTLKI